MLHYVTRSNPSRTLCGRELSRITNGTHNPREVSCRRCQKAWAKMLRDLPDVFPATPTPGAGGSR